MNKILHFCLIVCLLLAPLQVVTADIHTQENDSKEKAQALLDTLTPEERVGQLFLTTFRGPEAAPGTIDSNKIYDLIVKYHIGGVILRRENENFVGVDQTIPVLQSLTDQLQRNEYDGSLYSQTIPNSDVTFNPAFIPLFIAIAQDGDGYPYDQILSGLTSLPNPMAIGTTWEPELAQQVGSVLGKELKILGINMLFGPSLDVLESRYPESGSGLGVRTFGGDPYWVGEMGKAFVQGVHQGAGNKIAVVGKHFPGLGGADRLPEDEIATIRKTLEQLKQFELYPFFSVTGNAPTPEATVDALLTTHIRYQGFQENFRQTTKPVSFDSQALTKLLELTELKTWRENGGVMISDNLGSRAVRRFYDPSGQTFNARIAALDAFLAGNDILYLDNFISSDDPDYFTTITRTLSTFALRYREDETFAQRVNSSVLRILTLKYHLYGNVFRFTNTLPLTGQKNELGYSTSINSTIAQQAATLISPPLSELDPTIPGIRDQIVFITDTRSYQQCTRCNEREVMAVNALEQAVVRFYSPVSGGKISPGNLSSYSLTDLQEMLIAGVGQREIETAILQAEWIVFSILDTTSNVPSSQALRQFLTQRLDLIQGKRVIVFAFNAPYFLDATDISKLIAYYSLYSRSLQFIEVAAKLLFQEILPQGDPPVSIPGIGYYINEKTFPDPNQVITIYLDIPQSETDQITPTPEAIQPITNYKIGDLIPLRTGEILDHNRHRVPDGTIVRFILTTGGDPSTIQQTEAQTIQGIARTMFQIPTAGNIEIHAESEMARQSTYLQFVIPSENPTPTELIPTAPPPTNTLEPTTTASPTLMPTPTPTSTPIIAKHTTIGDWFSSLMVSLILAILCFWIAGQVRQTKIGVRGSLFAIIFGILGYTYLALELPGSEIFLEKNGSFGVVGVTALAAIIGITAAVIWNRLSQTQK